MNPTYLIIYTLLFVFFFWRYIKRRKNFDIGAFVILLYLFYALLGILLVFDQTSLNDLGFQDFKIKLFPLLYLFICLIISFSPVLSYNSKSFAGIKPPRFNLDIIAWFFIFCYIFQIGTIYSNLSHGIYMILFMDDGARELYGEMLDKADTGGVGISNIFSIFGNLIYGFGILLFFYYLTLPKRNKVLIWGVGVALLIGVLEYVASGQRGGMIKRLLVILGTYFIFKDYIGEKTKKYFKLVAIIIASFLAVLFMAISISRFGEREGGVISSFNRYGGEAILNFDKYAFDNNGLRYGDRTFPMFKRMLLFENVPRNFIERRAKYPRLYINDEVFITFVGDFCLDFGPIVAFIIIALFSYWSRGIVHFSGNYYPFHKLIILQFTMSIVVEGGSLFSYADTGNLGIISTFLIYGFFWMLYNNKQSTNVIAQC